MLTTLQHFINSHPESGYAMKSEPPSEKFAFAAAAELASAGLNENRKIVCVSRTAAADGIDVALPFLGDDARPKNCPEAVVR
jgi:hypothetical protein